MKTNQHWIPRSLLQRFASPDGRPNQVYRIDVRTGATVGPTAARNFSAKRHYNRVNLLSKPDTLENLFQVLEGPMARAIAHIERTDSMPDSVRLNHVAAAMALQALRTPLHERHAIDEIAEVRRQHPEDVPEQDSEQEAALAWARRLARFDPTRLALGKKPWTLLVAPTDGPYFVCPDPPPYLGLLDEDALGSVASSDVDKQEVLIVFPLTRRHLLASSPRFEKGLITLNQRGVAYYNMLAFNWAREFVYSPVPKPHVEQSGVFVLDREGVHFPHTG